MLRTTGDILKGVLRRCGEFTDGSSPYQDAALRYINQVHRSIISGSSEFNVDVGEPWVWARASNPISLILEPARTTGTVSVTNGSTSASFSSAPATSQVGNLLKVDGEEDYFRIATHTAAATAFTLDANYTGTTNTVAAYKVIQLQYQLGTDILRLVEPIRIYRNAFGGSINGIIEGMHINALRRAFPLVDLQGGIPTAFAITYDSDGTSKITFNRYPSERIKLDIDYIPIPSDLVDQDGSVPLLPIEHRPILEYGATYFLMLDKNDNRAANYFEMTSRAMAALVQSEKKEQTHIDLNKGRIMPRQDSLTSSQGPLRSESGFIIG